MHFAMVSIRETCIYITYTKEIFCITNALTLVERMPGGYMGKILRVNLTKGKIKEERLPEDVLRT